MRHTRSILLTALTLVFLGAGCQKDGRSLQASNSNASAVLYLESHIEKANFGGKMFCAFAELPRQKNDTYADHTGYWMVTCQEYYVAEHQLKQGTGVSVPVVAVLDPLDSHVIEIRQPKDASYKSDIMRFFPKRMANKIVEGYQFNPDLQSTAATYFATLLKK